MHGVAQRFACAGKLTEYTLDGSDFFWAENKAETFPEVAQRVEALLKEHQATVQSLQSGTEDLSTLDDGDVTAGLKSIVNSMPELQRKKRLVDIHTNVATALMRHIQDRGLDTLFEMEDRMAASGLLPDVRTLKERIGPDGKGTADDKLRLLLQYYLAGDDKDKEVEGLARAMGDDVSTLAVDYVRKVRMMRRIAATGQHDDVKGAGAVLKDLVSQHTALSSGLGWLKGNVKSLLPLKHKTPLTRAVREIMLKPAAASVTASWRVMDPRAPQGKAIPQVASKARDAIVVVCGGGCYAELHNLVEWARDVSASTPSQPPVSIVYGSTEMAAPSDLLRQMEQLAQPDTPNLT